MSHPYAFAPASSFLMVVCFNAGTGGSIVKVVLGKYCNKVVLDALGISLYGLGKSSCAVVAVNMNGRLGSLCMATVKMETARVFVLMLKNVHPSAHPRHEVVLEDDPNIVGAHELLSVQQNVVRLFTYKTTKYTFVCKK